MTEKKNGSPTPRRARRAKARTKKKPSPSQPEEVDISPLDAARADAANARVGQAQAQVTAAQAVLGMEQTKASIVMAEIQQKYVPEGMTMVGFNPEAKKLQIAQTDSLPG